MKYDNEFDMVSVIMLLVKGGRINGKKAVWKVEFGQFKILAPSFFIENIISERATAFIIAYLTQ